MEETLFYVFGIALVLAALVVSAMGLRWEAFPQSRPLFAGVVALFAVLVVGTAAFGWLNAEEEQEHREAELAEEQAAQEEGEAGPGGEGDAAETTTTVPEGVDGAQVFADAGCGGCHVLAAAGTTAQTGPNLDGALEGRSASYIETAIVDPNRDIAEGFPPNVMPQNFGDELSPDELQALVQFLAQSAGQQG